MKEYVAPTVKRIDVMANQSIASCAITDAGYQLSDKWTSTFYPTVDDALNSQPDPQSATRDIVFPVYTYAGTKDHGTWSENFSGMWADTNKNGNMDDTDIIYNQQGNRPNIVAMSNVFSS